MNKIVAVSGGMDPIHAGHIRMIKEARQHGDVVIILNSDKWLFNKKGFCFMNWEDRAEILREIRGVIDVISVDDSDGSVCSALVDLKPDIFANGGDRTRENIPEIETCEDHNITMLWGVGGGKIASSSELVARVTGEK